MSHSLNFRDHVGPLCIFGAQLYVSENNMLLIKGKTYFFENLAFFSVKFYAIHPFFWKQGSEPIFLDFGPTYPFLDKSLHFVRGNIKYTIYWKLTEKVIKNDIFMVWWIREYYFWNLECKASNWTNILKLLFMPGQICLQTTSGILTPTCVVYITIGIILIWIVLHTNDIHINF